MICFNQSADFLVKDQIKMRNWIKNGNLFSLLFSFFKDTGQPEESRSGILRLGQSPPVEGVAVVGVHGNHAQTWFDQRRVISTVSDGRRHFRRKPIRPQTIHLFVQPRRAELLVQHFRWSETKSIEYNANKKTVWFSLSLAPGFTS